MWTLDLPISGHLGGSPITPLEVLYEFDEPMIFTARIGIVPAIVRKMTQMRDAALFVVVFVVDEKLALLKEGKLSVRGAFEEEHSWIIELDHEFRAQRYWDVHTSEIPRKYLPKSGVGLFHWLEAVPDTIEQANALLAIKFKGEGLKADGMAFGKFKNLIDRTYNAARRALTPAALMGTKSASFDLEIAQPKFASLLIAIKEPVFSTNAITRLRRARNIDGAALRRAVHANQQQFAIAIKDISEQAREGHIDAALAAERFGLLDNLSQILPTKDGDVSRVEFSTNVSGVTSTVYFDRETSGRVREAINVAQQGTVVEEGPITGLTESSSSILILSRRDKTVRCFFDKIVFSQLVDRGDLRLKKYVSISGKLDIRPRVDLLDVETFRTIENPN